MRIEKNLRKDRETLLRFLDVFGAASGALGSSNKHAQPSFFLLGGSFIHEYIVPVFFRKVDVLLSALMDAGLPSETGAVGAMKDEQEKCRESANVLVKAAKDWQDGDASARLEVSWGASEFTTTMRQLLDRLKNLIFPLLEQNLAPEDEQTILEGLNNIASAGGANDADKHIKLIETLEDELSDWK